MGSLTYDGTVVSFDDRLLTHLQIVIVQQFRRRESFTMSWLDPLSAGDGRSSVWLHPECHLYFKFSGSRVPAINEEWLRRLTDSARGSHGLVVTQEDGRLARAEGLGLRR
ncbi:ATP-dependent DNA ligase [Amnibacterium sp.]|uniref:DUF7882 family protein n=1 Tax=Amnibacterium sp. TaxID=1872496 RepID=UPI002625B97D|nr:ATP-dependent DNA ligase [Amnibacterium sp.]MCU1472540.1 ATP-dependent ligase [Amnibacterium sp.]